MEISNMNKFLKLLGIGLLIISFNTFARSSIPIVDHTDVQLNSANGKPLTLEQVKKALTLAGAEHAWTFEAGGDKNSLVGTLVVRNKHTAVVDIKIGASTVSVTYKNSANLNFKEENGQKLIHPGYNKWIQNFVSNIQKETSKMDGAGK
jgi:hypothetical protein